MIAALKRRAAALLRDVTVLALAMRDPRTPWAARILAAAVVAYVFSPIDLIPDFIPVLGLLDDLILAPLGVLLALRMIPPPVLADLRRQAAALGAGERRRSLIGAAMVVAVWALLAAAVALAARAAG